LLWQPAHPIPAPTISVSGWSRAEPGLTNCSLVVTDRSSHAFSGLTLSLLLVGCVHLPPDEPDVGSAPEGRLAVADGWLAGTARGTAPGVPVVFLHGLGGNHHFFDAQLEHVQRQAHVIAYDQRGCGESSLAPRKKYDIDVLAGDLGVILDAARVQQAVLVGHSFGADVITRYASLHADRVAALVLVEPPGDIRTRVAARYSELAAGDDPTFWHGIDTLIDPLLTGARPETRQLVIASMHATPRDVLQRMLQGIGAFDPVAAMHDYGGPVLCIVGPRASAFDARSVPCGRVVTIQETSHWPMLDQPERVNEAIDEVVASTRQPRPGH
jgi:pimeloyl-ACP methyl ester carboxylesterase